MGSVLRLDQPSFPVFTERLALRPLREEDDEIDALYAYRSNPEVVRYTYRAPMTRNDAAAHIASVAAARPSADGEWLGLGVERRSDAKLLGEASLCFRSIELEQGEVGYVFSPEAAGQGYATEAVAALFDLAFGHYGFHRLVARIDEDNLPSIRVAERLGMRREARLVENDRREGHWATEVDYAVLDREWSSR